MNIQKLFQAFVLIALLFLFMQIVSAECYWSQTRETIQDNSVSINDGRIICNNGTLYQCLIWGCTVHTECNGVFTSDVGDTVGSWTCRQNGTSGIWCQCSENSCSPANNHKRCDGCLFTVDVSNTEVCDGIDNDCDGVIDNGFDCAKNSAGCSNTCKKICSSFTYSDWAPATCPQNGQQTRTILSRLPVNCEGGNPDSLVRNCTYIPPCTANDWSASLSPVTCPPSGQQTRTWTKIGNCTGGVQKPETEPVACTYQAPACVFTYSDYNSCQPNNLQTRTVLSQSPSNCQGNPQDLSKPCTYIPPTRLSNCDLSEQGNVLPENAFWNDAGKGGQFLQTWSTDQNAYLPVSLKANFSENIYACNYFCLQFAKTCALNPVTYCGTGIQDCNKGYWSTCRQGDAQICTQNQFCNSATMKCAFCASDKKNCDRNLANGCEASVLVDVNNCGSCGNACSTGACVNGKCGNSVDINRCMGVSCGGNSSCDSSTGACNCINGYNDCDGNSLNGCEKNGSCNVLPNSCQFNSDCNSSSFCSNGSCVAKQCLINSDCDSGKVCSNFKCAAQGNPQGSCIAHRDCENDDEWCVEGRCVKHSCASPLVMRNHECVCNGTICNKTCYSGTGICCKTIWNPGLESCSASIAEEEELVIDVGDGEAIALIQDAKKALDRGEVAKAKAMASVGEMRALMVQKELVSEYSTKFEEARTALGDNAFDDAEEIAKEAVQELKNASEKPKIPWNLIIIGVIAVVLIAGFFVFRKSFSKKPPLNPQ